MIRKSSTVFLALGFLLLIGCEPRELVVWSPDGSRAAVIGSEGLYLSDASGALTGVLIPAVERVAWIDDRTVVVARKVRAENWEELVRLIGTARAQAIAAEADAGVRELLAFPGTIEQFGERATAFMAEHPRRNLLPMMLYLRDHPNEQLAKRVGPEFSENLRTFEGVDVAFVETWTISGIEVTRAADIHAGFDEVTSLRVSPTRKQIAFIAGSSDMFSPDTLWLAGTDGKQPPVEVATFVGANADFSPDGMFLAYSRAGSVNRDDRDHFRLGTIRRIRVLDDAGTPLPEVRDRPPEGEKDAAGAEELAKIVFFPQTRIRYLANGSILFSGGVMNFPIASSDVSERLALFVVTPGETAKVERLTKDDLDDSLKAAINYFEVSPDSKRIAIAGTGGSVVVMELATLQFSTLQEANSNKPPPMIPTWRTSDELSYATLDGEGKIVSIRVQKLDGSAATDLSANWAVEIVRGLGPANRSTLPGR